MLTISLPFISSTARPAGKSAQFLMRSKDIFERKLDITPTARALNLAEARVAAIGHGVAQHFMVERVEQLEPEVQSMPFSDRKSLVQGRIIGEASWSAKGVVAEGAKTVLRVRRCHIERRRVQPRQSVGVDQVW